MANGGIYGYFTPAGGLLSADGQGGLQLGGEFWGKFKSYLQLTSALPQGLAGITEATGKDIEALRKASEAFGSPRKLRAALVENPDLLSSDSSPDDSYNSIVWLVQELGNFAKTAQSVLGVLNDMSDSPGSDAIAKTLRYISTAAQKVGAPTGPVLEAIRSTSDQIVAADKALNASFASEAKTLGQMQQNAGGAGFEVGDLDAKIQKLGLLTSASKKKALQDQLQSARQRHADNSLQAQKLRETIAKLEDVQALGHWLHPGISDVNDFLKIMRETIMSYARNLSQLSIDITPEQGVDRDWIASELNSSMGIRQWQKVETACEKFVAAALIDP